MGAEKAGSLDVLLSLPISRTQALFGKYLGRLLVFVGGMLVGLAVGGVVTAAYVGVANLGPYAVFTLGTVGVSLAFLSLTILLSTLAAEKTSALGAALAVWVWFALLHDLAALGLIATVHVPKAILTGMVLLNPVDLFRLLVLSSVHTVPGGFAALLSKASLSLPVLVGGLVVWIVVPLLVSFALISRRRM